MRCRSVFGGYPLSRVLRCYPRHGEPVLTAVLVALAGFAAGCFIGAALGCAFSSHIVRETLTLLKQQGKIL